MEEKDYPIAKNLEELSKEKQQEFEELAEQYSNALQLMNLFIEVNELDFDDTWNKANQRHDENLTYAPNDEE